MNEIVHDGIYLTSCNLTSEDGNESYDVFCIVNQEIVDREHIGAPPINGHLKPHAFIGRFVLSSRIMDETFTVWPKRSRE